LSRELEMMNGPVSEIFMDGRRGGKMDPIER
jgi:hypothetical protein